MCMFSTFVAHVAETRIFACADGELHTLVYQSAFSSTTPVAMLLPIPAVGDVELLDLSAHADFFAMLGALFPVDMGELTLSGDDDARAPLPVVRVGGFDASWLPSSADLDRVDARLPLSPGVRAAARAYDGFGFAVFAFAAGRGAPHPFGVRFRAHTPDTLFFPTVHVHDERGRPAVAAFDHELFLQGIPVDDGGFVRGARRAPAQLHPGFPGGHVRRRVLRGRLPNDDVRVRLWPTG